MKILLVDGEPTILGEMGKMLAQILPKAELCSFTSVRQAKRFAEQNEIGIAFLDADPRTVDGISLAKQLQTQKNERAAGVSGRTQRRPRKGKRAVRGSLGGCRRGKKHELSAPATRIFTPMKEA